MVSLVKLSSSNIDALKQLVKTNLNLNICDKDFFLLFEKSSVIKRFMLKKFIKLFYLDGTFIGYIWHENLYDCNLKILALYIIPEYIDKVNKNTLRTFDSNQVVYETIDSEYHNNLLINLGFRNSSSSLLMYLDLNLYTKEYEINNIYDNLSNFSFNTLNTNFYKSKKTIITFHKLACQNDFIIRCEIQNDVFSEINRIPLSLDDVKNDIVQDYYIEDLAYFINVNGLPIGYGQVIKNGHMYTIVNFGIIEEYRGFGFGKLLLDFIITKAYDMNIRNLYLRVAENNISAIQLYSWFGFENISIVNKWKRN